jgi:uroporphyrinogen decarboxylase
MNSRQRFLKAASCQPVDRAPVWLMRQAGRFLPEYRALKEKYDFLQMVRTPELAVEVTLQPLKRFPLDAAILFSDILVIPEALGQPYSFREKGGISLDFALRSAADMERLQTSDAMERLMYVPDTLKILRKELGDNKALLGFGGSPWTLACYMIAGGSDPNCLPARQLFYQDRSFFERLLELLADTLIDFFKMQIAAGVDAIQIFDSWAALCPYQEYRSMSLKWIEKIIRALPADFPVIVFAKGMAHAWPLISETGASVISCDWTTPVQNYREAWHAQKLAWQGNLDPILLTTSAEQVQRGVQEVLRVNNGLPGHIFNLGHGMIPQAKPELVQVLCETLMDQAGSR